MWQKQAYLRVLVSWLVLFCPLGEADSGQRFVNLADDPGSGLDYARGRSANYAAMTAFRAASLAAPITPNDLPFSPHRVHGLSGVAVLDYDGDDDLDLYVTNGPGRANSLFQNQLAEHGELRFVDVAAEAGVDATAMDSQGACYADIDNDGDRDLLVLGRMESNHLYVNNGGGVYEKSAQSGLESAQRNAAGCSFGDVNLDGFVDVVVINSWDFRQYAPCFFDVEDNPVQHNQLFINQGDGTFVDVSAHTGMEQLFVSDANGKPVEGHATITWAVGVLDVDLDGDQDIMLGDDQCAMLPTKHGGPVDRGWMHVLLNDGQGNFVDRPVADRAESSSAWMGFSWGDYNCDGHLDVFGSSMGDYNFRNIGFPSERGEHASRWLLGDGAGGFEEVGVGRLITTAFGWGNATFDYDNDGDQDLVYHGGLDVGLVALSDNPGQILNNQGCSAEFVWDRTALRTDYHRYHTQGLATGDLNNDGLVDFVTVSNLYKQESLELVPGVPQAYGGLLDEHNVLIPAFAPNGDGLSWNGTEYENGRMTVEINSGDNGRESVTVELLGTTGITSNGAVNRDGIGAVVSLTPRGGRTAMSPVVGGSSYASQNALGAHFGMGQARRAVVDVLWPGGVRNKLIGVTAGTRVLFPEIPCSYDGPWSDIHEYRRCVKTALDELEVAAILDSRQSRRFMASALRAFREYRDSAGRGVLSH